MPHETEQDKEQQISLDAFERPEGGQNAGVELRGFRYLKEPQKRQSLLRDAANTPALRTSILLSPRTYARLGTVMRRLSDSAAVEGLSRRDVRLMDVLDEIVKLALEDTAGPCYDGQLISAVLKRADRHGAYRHRKRLAKREGTPIEREIIQDPDEE